MNITTIGIDLAKEIINPLLKMRQVEAACHIASSPNLHAMMKPRVLRAVAGVGNAHDFKNGRQFAAWVGLTPRQYSSGGKPSWGALVAAAMRICVAC